MVQYSRAGGGKVLPELHAAVYFVCWDIVLSRDSVARFSLNQVRTHGAY